MGLKAFPQGVEIGWQNTDQIYSCRYEHHPSESAWLPQPQRCCCHLILDHFHIDGGCNCLLLDGIDECGKSLEDINECRCFGDLSCRCSLLLHARVLGYLAQLAHPVPLH